MALTALDTFAGGGNGYWGVQYPGATNSSSEFKPNTATSSKRGAGPAGISMPHNGFLSLPTGIAGGLTTGFAFRESTNAPGTICEFRDTGGAITIYLERPVGSPYPILHQGGYQAISTRPLYDPGSASIRNWHYIEIDIRPNGGAGSNTLITLRIDELVAATLETPNTVPFNTDFLRFKGALNNYGYRYFTDWYVTSLTGGSNVGFMGDISVAWMQAISTTSLTPGCSVVGAATVHEALDDAPPGQDWADYVDLALDNANATFKIGPPIPANMRADIRGVSFVQTTSYVSGTSAQVANQYVNGGSTKSSFYPLTGTYKNYGTIWETNEISGVAWSADNLDLYDFRTQIY